MRNVNLRAGAAIAALLAAGPVLGEVRLVENPTDGSLAVDIRSTPRGPWTPTGSVTSRVLNPVGDLFGDTMPGWDTRIVSVQSAWIRPGTSLLHRALGLAPGWTELPPIASPGAYGQPMVDVLTDGWSICWQQSDAGSPQITVTGTLTNGTAVAPVLVSDGTLIGTVPSGNTLQVISMSAGGTLWCTTVLFTFVPTQPIPIQIEVLGRVSLGLGGPTQGPHPNSGTGGSILDDGILSSADPRLHEFEKHGGDDSTLLTFWSDENVLNSVEIGPEGPEFPVTSRQGRKGSSHPQKLLEETLREAQQD